MCLVLVLMFFLCSLKEEDVRYLRDIEQFYTTEITEMPMDVADLI